MNRQYLLKEIERFGKIKPSQWNMGHTVELKGLLRKLYVFVRDREEKIKTAGEMTKEELTKVFR